MRIMQNVKHTVQEFFRKISTPSPKELSDITRKEAVLVLLCAVFYLLNHIHVPSSHFVVEQSSVVDVDHQSLFDFISHPATVERWFQWVYHFQSLDRRPPGPGKKYRAILYIPYIGYEKIDFRMRNFSADSYLVLESFHLLGPTVAVLLSPQGRSQTLLTITIQFGDGSLLYQLTVGAYLRHLASKHTVDALQLLRSTTIRTPSNKNSYLPN